MSAAATLIRSPVSTGEGMPLEPPLREVTTLRTPERVFLVTQRAAARGAFPGVEPVVLVEPALMHRYPCVLEIELVDPPAEAAGTTAPTGRPVFVIDSRELPLHSGTRLAAVIGDRRNRSTV